MGRDCVVNCMKVPESTEAQNDRAFREYMGEQESPTSEELQEIKESFCEACKGFWWMEEIGCYKACEGFLEELESVRGE